MANPNSIETSMTSVVVAEIAGGGCRCHGVLSSAGRVAKGIQDVLDIVLDIGELHRHVLHRGGGGRGCW
jgi:hypothetical protein